MEFLITILLMLVPLVFKGIEKGLTKAAPQQGGSPYVENESDDDDDDDDEIGQAQDEKLETIRRTLSEVFPTMEHPIDVVESDEVDIPVDKVPVEYVPVSKLTEIQPVKSKAMDVMVENDVENIIPNNDIRTSDKKEKIDAKKLIIYSEIMKPKY